MKLVSNEFKENIKTAGRMIKSEIKYTLNGEEIILDDNNLFNIIPSFNTNILKSTMKKLEFETNKNIQINTLVNFRFGIKVNDDYEFIDFGNYIVYSIEKKEETESYYITCYDKMLYSMTEYVKIPITYPITIRDYINSLCTFLGLTFANKNDTFANYNKNIPNELYLDSEGNSLGYTFRDVFDELAQVTASTICINENDELEIRYINETSDIIDENTLKNINITFGEKYGPINSIVLSRSGQSDNIYLKDENSIETNGLCELKIIDNQIMNFNNRDEYLPSIFEKLNGLEYYINDFATNGICYYDICDKYSVKIQDMIYPCIMFNDEINITQGLEENIFTEKPEETETDYTKADKTDRKINQTYLIVDKQNQQIQAVISQTDAQNEKIAQVTQTVNELNSKISDIADITISKETNSGTLEFENINQSEPIRIIVRPIGEHISYLYPNNYMWPTNEYQPATEGLVPSETMTPSNSLVPRTRRKAQDVIYLKDRKIRFHNKTTNENFDMILPDDLLYYNNEIYDEFILDYGGLSCVINKKLGYNADESVYILDNPKTIEYEYPHLELTDGNYSVTLQGYNNAYLFVQLMAQNIYTTQFATRAELNSEISQTSQEINLSVDKKLENYSTTTQMNAQIQLTASSITNTVKETYATKDELETTESTFKQTTDSISLEVNNKVNNSDYTSAQIIAKINDGTSEATINADKISLEGKEINLTSEDIVVKSENLNIDSDGKIHLLDTGSTSLWNFDIESKYAKNNIGSDGLFIVDNYNNPCISMSAVALGKPLIQVIEASSNLSKSSSISYDEISVIDNDSPYSYKFSQMTATEIMSPVINQTSLVEAKKNIEMQNEGLSIIENTDIYNYNLKFQEDNEKKHIGVVIGEGYNTPKEILSNNNKAVDLYSMIAVSWRAIQELNDKVKCLEEKLKESDK